MSLRSQRVNAHASNIGMWRTNGNLSYLLQNPPSLFSPRFAQPNIHPCVILNNSLLPLERVTHILGVTFNPHLTFWAHVDSITVAPASSRIKILKAFAYNWVQQKETIITTYISLIRSFFMYAALIWFPNVSSFLVDKLQAIQKSALCIATGCVKADRHGATLPRNLGVQRLPCNLYVKYFGILHI